VYFAQCHLDPFSLAGLSEELERDMKRLGPDEPHIRRKPAHSLDEPFDPPPNVFVDVECQEKAHDQKVRGTGCEVRTARARSIPRASYLAPNA
jgi:hypothetical protein